MVAPPRAVSTRTRLFVSLTDEQVLTQVGEHLGSLLRSDLATRCRLGAGPKYLERAKRQRVLTPHCSSRWAGAITQVTDDTWERELLNLEDLECRDRKEIAELGRRLALPVGKGKKKKRGYATRSERYQKQRRRQKLPTPAIPHYAQQQAMESQVGSVKSRRFRPPSEKVIATAECLAQVWIFGSRATGTHRPDNKFVENQRIDAP